MTLLTNVTSTHLIKNKIKLNSLVSFYLLRIVTRKLKSTRMAVTFPLDNTRASRTSPATLLASSSSLLCLTHTIPSHWPPRMHLAGSCLRTFVFAILSTWNEPLRYLDGWLPHFPHISAHCYLLRLLRPSSIKCHHHPPNSYLSPLLSCLM